MADDQFLNLDPLNWLQEIREIWNGIGLDKSADKLRNELESLTQSIMGNTKALTNFGADSPDSLFGGIKALGTEMSHLCADITRKISECGCAGTGGGISPSAFIEPFALSSTGSAMAGDGAPLAAPLQARRVRGRNQGIKVEVHNYGAPKGMSSSAGGRKVETLVGEAVAKDIRRGGPASIAMNHTFGVPRQPVRR